MESMQLNSLNAIEPALAEGVTIEPEIVSEAIPSRATNIEIDITNEMSTPYAPNEITPKVGMSFAFIDAAYKFYNNYAWYCGFSTRKNTSRKAKSGEILRQILTCSRAGPGQEKRSNKGGFVSRCSCPAKLYLNFNRDGNTYDVSQFLPMHNHALCTPTKTRKLRSHKKLTEDDLGLISSLKASGIGVARSINFMRHEVGGSSHLHFSERDARNALRRKRQMMFVGDANSLLRYFQQKSQENSQFSYEIQDPVRCCNFFRWVDQFVALMRGDVSMEESRTKVQVERQVHPFNHDEIVEERQLLPFNNHDEIVADIGEMVHCVTNLREIQIAEIHEIKQMQKATTDELKDKMEHLKEIIIMRDGELKKAFEIRDREILNLKRAMMIVVGLVAIVVVVNCYLLL